MTGRTLSALQQQASRAHGLLRYSYIEECGVFFDLIIIVASSVLTGILYHLAVINSVGEIETFLGIGGLTAVNFSAIFGRTWSVQAACSGRSMEAGTRNDDCLAACFLRAVGGGIFAQNQ